MKTILSCLISFAATLSMMAQSQRIVFTPEDSMRIEALLKTGAQQPKGTNMVLYFAKQFLGIPYVGATLEVADPEQLVINLRELDCTTYVETVSALALTHSHHQRKFSDYCYWLTQLRYQQGKLTDYPSRNHYFSTWIENAEQMGLAKEQGQNTDKAIYPFNAQQTLQIHFMSQHAELYPALKKHAEFIPIIAQAEKALNGRKINYIPIAALTSSKELRKAVKDGDILAMVTRRDGLDVSHVGFAIWDEKGRLHLMNASSLHKRVVNEEKSLQQYLKSQRLQPGIRVIRLKLK